MSNCVGCHDVLSATESVRLAVLLSIKSNAWRCNQYSKTSVNVSIILLYALLFFYEAWQFGIGQRLREFFAALYWLRTIRKCFDLKKLTKNFFRLWDLIWEVPSAFSFTLCNMQWRFYFGWRYCIVSSQAFGIISVDTVMVACSASSLCICTENWLLSSDAMLALYPNGLLESFDGHCAPSGADSRLVLQYLCCSAGHNQLLFLVSLL